jgi:protein SCO1/2
MLSLHRAVVTFILGGVLVAACSQKAPEDGARSYPLTGTVVAVAVDERTLTIAHEDIPGFMPAMTMDFVVLPQDAALLQNISPGDEVSARLVVPDSRYWLEDLVVVKKGTADPNASPPAEDREIRPGDPLPDVALVNQDGDAIRLSDYHGRVLALTFVFTRCPFPDFCPRMMARFAAAHAALVADAEMRERTHLLTVSFDPEYDTPAVLREYGAPFQKTAPPFTHWELATGTDDAIRTLGEALGLTYVEESQSFSHNLRTAVVDPEGRLVTRLRGNEWTSDDLIAAIEQAAAKTP